VSKALLIIDMLEDFVSEKGALYIGTSAKDVVQKTAGVLNYARREGISVIYICDSHHKDDSEFAMFPPHCIQGSRGAGVVEVLKPLPEERVIRKRRFSAFFGTDLDLYLREQGIEELILTGVCTNICVLYTAADACMLNYQVIVLTDCVASFDEEAHRFALREMEKTLGASLQSSSEINF